MAADLKKLTTPYGNTIAAQLQRITDAHEIILDKAIKMALNVLPNEAGNGNTKTPLIDNDTIMKTASAVNNISVWELLGVKQNEDSSALTTTLNAGLSLTIPIGYNKTQYTISASSIESLLDTTTALSKHILNTKTAYRVYTDNGTKKYLKITGSLANVFLFYKSSTNTAYDANKVSGNYLKVSINAPSGNTYSTSETLITNIPYRTTGSTTATEYNGGVSNLKLENYDKTEGSNVVKYLKIIPTEGYYDSVWNTNIKYQPLTSADLTIDRSTAEDGTDTFEVSSVTIPAGYYADPVTVRPILHTTTEIDKPDRIINYFTGPLTSLIDVKTGTLKNFLGGKSYDYIDPETKFSIRSASNFTLNITDNPTQEVTVGNTETSGFFQISALVKGTVTASTEGWFDTSGELTDNSSVVGKIAKATIKAEDNVIKTNSPGYIPVNQTLLTLNTTNITINTSATSGKTYESQTLNLQVLYINVPKGYIFDKYIKITSKAGNITLSNTISGTAKVTPVISVKTGSGETNLTNYMMGTITITKPQSGYYIALLTAASSNNVSAKCTTTSFTAGWIGTKPSDVSSASVAVGANASKMYYIPINAESLEYAITEDDLLNKKDGDTYVDGHPSDVKFKFVSPNKGFITDLTVDMSIILTKLLEI